MSFLQAIDFLQQSSSTRAEQGRSISPMIGGQSLKSWSTFFDEDDDTDRSPQLARARPGTALLQISPASKGAVTESEIQSLESAQGSIGSPAVMSGDAAARIPIPPTADSGLSPDASGAVIASPGGDNWAVVVPLHRGPAPAASAWRKLSQPAEASPAGGGTVSLTL